MKHLQKLTFILGVFVSLNALGQTRNATFSQIYNLLDQSNFFKAKEIYASDENDLPMAYRKFTEAILDNAFNRLEASQRAIDALTRGKMSIPDSLQFKLYETKADNAIKLYHYKEAKNAVTIILNDYKRYLTDKEADDYRNNLKIWTALEDVKLQKVVIRQNTSLKMIKDKAGLNNLKVSAHGDTLNFIFDTGANISTTSQSVARQLKMKMLPGSTDVDAITGKKVKARMAVCDKLMLGNIELSNVVFLVMPDEALSFPKAHYQIYGILGFPVIEALKEVQITLDGDFIVPKKETTFAGNSNMAMNGLTPLIYIDGKHFTFDTGADHTMLYHKFYVENRDSIDKHYQLQKISFGGAGGKAEFDGYIINQQFHVSGKDIVLKHIHLLKDKISDDETVYGNIGEDMIHQFHKMTLNFDHMFIRFE